MLHYKCLVDDGIKLVAIKYIAADYISMFKQEVQSEMYNYHIVRKTKINKEIAIYSLLQFG